MAIPARAAQKGHGYTSRIRRTTSETGALRIFFIASAIDLAAVALLVAGRVGLHVPRAIRSLHQKA